MSNNKYVYMPPEAQPYAVGLVYHGLVTDSNLSLPNNTTIPYRQPTDGSVLIVEAPNATPVSSKISEEDRIELLLDGKVIKSYAYLSGREHDIGEHRLGKNRWLYCDGENTWIMRYEFNFDSQTPLNSTFDIYVDSLFGRFDDNDYPSINKKIYSYSVQNPYAVWGLDPSTCWPPIVYYSKTGNKILVNLLDWGDLPMVCVPNNVLGVYVVATWVGNNDSCWYRGLYESFLIEIHDIGSILLSSLGDNIYCTSSVIYGNGPLGAYERIYLYDDGNVLMEPPLNPGLYCNNIHDLAMPCEDLPYPDCSCYDNEYNESHAEGYAYRTTQLYVMDCDGNINALSYESYRDTYAEVAYADTLEPEYTFTDSFGEDHYRCVCDTVTYSSSSTTKNSHIIKLGSTILYSYPEWSVTSSTNCSRGDLCEPTYSYTNTWWLPPIGEGLPYYLNGGAYVLSDYGYNFIFYKTGQSDDSPIVSVYDIVFNRKFIDSLNFSHNFTFDPKEDKWYTDPTKQLGFV